MKVYICGSRHHERELYNTEALLRQQGHIPVNPIKVLYALPKEINNSDFTVITFELIRICDALYLIDGWEKDLFASMELAYAKGMGKKIIIEKTIDNADIIFDT